MPRFEEVKEAAFSGSDYEDTEYSGEEVSTETHEVAFMGKTNMIKTSY